MTQGAFLAIDWGTTNRRVYRIDATDEVVATERDDRGMLAMEGGDYADEIARIRERHGDLSVLIAGMAGSNRGWRDAGYCPCPAGLADLAAAIAWIEPGRTGIVPGVSLATDTRADVMRGEEVQLLGAVASGMAGPDALFCQPGTHCKWADLTGGRITGFTTAMTGEVFALLRRHSILAPQLGGAIADGPVFRAGVERARDGDLLANLFDVRASAVLGRRADSDAAAYASGLVIGADVAARPLDRKIAILADPELGDLYRAAVETLGGEATILDSHGAFVAGITAIWRQL
ncbi:2-dehydro-3-deoxygalactonokinase [Stakelama saccharophila]|uniref:2-dehydro-3-deoxygalactonokinase n=1 Tax=Stakelama saccharophila TaxID=3075605 RepID=A0ABZ0BA68_9SPHN|nr:2-dehydro-3-deoxygalactonokinase [Stakelama sp. W311]WNO53561.1 2-dehydro-3-deoxygalactonokinase [Stakelama sp. W311]